MLKKTHLCNEIISQWLPTYKALSIIYDTGVIEAWEPDPNSALSREKQSSHRWSPVKLSVQNKLQDLRLCIETYELSQTGLVRRHRVSTKRLRFFSRSWRIDQGN